MTMEPLDLPALLGAVMWPLIALIVLAIFRSHITAVVGVLGRRIQKIAVGTVSLELAAMSEMKPAALDTEIRKLEAAPMVQSGPSSLGDFFTELRRGGKRDYIAIDLGSETAPRWLTSRLYLLAFLLTCFDRPMQLVFVETAGAARGRFIGTASADRVRWALARTYNWFELAIHSAFASLGQVQFEANAGFLADWQTSQLMQEFLRLIRDHPPVVPPLIPSPGAGTNIADWVTLNDGMREYAKWLDGARLERVLGSDLVASYVVLPPNKVLNDLTNLVLRQSGPFVAVVDTDRKFLNLIGRMTVLEGLATEFAKQVKQGET